MEKAKDRVLDWSLTAEREEKLDFVNELLRTLTEDELKATINVANKFKTKRKANKVVEYPSKVFKAHGSEVCGDSVTASAGPAVPQTFKGKREWWSQYLPNNINAIDCEMVEVKKSKKAEAATVSIFDFNDKEIYKGRVKHEPYSFVVNGATKKINGFRDYSLKDGEKLKDVSGEVDEKLAGKLVIKCGGGAKDFSCLNLEPTHYDVFDLHQHFYTLTYSVNGKPDRKPISLRRLVHYYFGVDIQNGIHDASIDAYYTMRLFREVYMKNKDGDISTRSEPDSDFYNFFDELDKLPDNRPKKKKKEPTDMNPIPKH